MPREQFINGELISSEQKQYDNSVIENIKAQREAETLVKYGISKEHFDKCKKEFLDTVDFETLREIFENIYKKSGFDISGMNFVGPERITFYRPRAAGMYNLERNDIWISPENINPAEMAIDSLYTRDVQTHNQALHKEINGSVMLGMLAVLIHEEAHAVSRNTTQRKYDEQNQLLGYMKTSGYDIEVDVDVDGDQKQLVMFRALNEGVVEKLARQITKRYLEEVGWKHEEVEVYKKSISERPKELRYPNEVALVDLIIRKISEYTNIPKEAVFDALVRGLMEGDALYSKEVVELFTKAFGEDFLPKLSGLNPSRRAGVIDFISNYRK